MALVDDPMSAVLDVLVGDFDCDGRPDAALVEIGKPQVSILFGRPRESPEDDIFEAPVLVPCVQGAWHLACGDIDAGGTQNIVVGSMGTPARLILLNNGDRTFRRTTDVAMPHDAQALALGDFDGDGHQDIACGVREYATLLFRNGGGSFGALTVSSGLFEGGPVFMHRFAAADFDADGRSDLVVCADRGLRVYPGARIERGAGIAPASAVALPLAGSGRYVDLADMNCDGKIDIADAIAILAHLFSQRPARCPDAANVNGDDTVDIADAIYVLARLFASGPPPLGAPSPCSGA
jgi:hypothetical protein